MVVKLGDPGSGSGSKSRPPTCRDLCANRGWRTVLSLGMTSYTVKVAVSVPVETMRSLELTRRRLGRSRSTIVAEALDAWLAARSAGERDAAYLAGYERFPETEDAGVALAIMQSWDTWEGEPTGAQTKRKRVRRVRKGGRR